LLSIQGSTATNAASFGSELINSGSWTLTAGWSTSDSISFAHAGSGGTTALTQAVPIAVGRLYKLVYTQSGRTTSSVTVSMGGTTLTANSTNAVSTSYIYTTTTGALTFTPTATTWNGTIATVSLTEVVNPGFIRLSDSTGAPVIDILGNSASLNNTAVGYQAGLSAFIGGANGANNSFFGNRAGMRIDGGQNNTGIGYTALGGANGATLGATGDENVAVGSGALASNVAGSANTAIGYLALNLNTTGNNTAVGWDAARLNTTGASNVCIGRSSCDRNTTGSRNTVVGYLSYVGNNTGSDNTAVGQGAGNGLAGNNNSFNTFVGSNSGTAILTGNSNTFLGYNTGTTTTTGSNNIILGSNLENATPDGSNQLNIGNLIFGTNLSTTFNGYSGNIGVGTTTPFAKLSVHANNGETNTILFAVASSTATATSTLVRINNIGQLLIGSTLANIVTSSTAIQAQGNILVDVGQQLGSATDGRFRWTPSTGTFNTVTNHIFQVNSVEMERMTAIGVGVGTSTPYTKLGVWGGDTLATTRVFEVSNNASTTLLRVQNDGSMFAPNTASAAVAQTGYWCYDTSGQFIRDTATCLVSAAKFKKNIQPLDIGLKELMKVKPVTYYNKDPQFGAGQQIGVIADQVATIDQRLIVRDSNGDIHGFNYEQYTAWLTKAIQEQQAEIEGKVIVGARSAEENWQWAAMALLVLWNLCLTFKKR
jgi:hypothetical protein